MGSIPLSRQELLRKCSPYTGANLTFWTSTARDLARGIADSLQCLCPAANHMPFGGLARQSLCVAQTQSGLVALSDYASRERS
jgi:hypothetical protein